MVNFLSGGPELVGREVRLRTCCAGELWGESQGKTATGMMEARFGIQTGGGKEKRDNTGQRIPDLWKAGGWEGSRPL